MPFKLDRSVVQLGALCIGGAAVLLHPASLAALGVGVWLGYKGRDWLQTTLDIDIGEA